jgi:hypothetical protein
VLVFVKVKIPSADTLVAQHPIGRRELSHNQPASAEVFDEAAEDSVSNSGHGREHRSWSNADVADGEGVWKGAQGWLIAGF